MARFGDAIEIFPVEPGDIWKAGPHRFLCGDVIEHQHTGRLNDLVRSQVDAVYTDPPWNSGTQKMFHTSVGVPITTSFESFLVALVDLLKKSCPTGPVFFDMGQGAFPFLREVLQKADAVEWAVGTTTYGNLKKPRPCMLWAGTFGSHVRQLSIPPGMHGRQVIQWVMGEIIKPGCVYFDPCCGNLEFSSAAIQTGATVLGCELIPAKLAQGLLRLSKKGHKVGKED